MKITLAYLVNKLEGMKKDDGRENGGGYFTADGKPVVYSKGEIFGYNQALSDVIKDLKESS